MRTFFGKGLKIVSNLGYLGYLGYLGVIGVGVGIGLVVIPGQKKKPKPEKQLTQFEQQKPAVEVVQSETELVEAKRETLEGLLLEAQALLSQAVAISQENKNDTQMRARNEKIVALINEAITTINQAIVQAPSDPRPWAQRAKIYQTVAAYLPEGEQQAIADWQRAIKLNPHSAEYCRQIAKIYLKRGENKAAIFYLKKAVLANPTDPNLLQELAQQEAKAGLLSLAQQTYQKLLALLTNEEQKRAIQERIDQLEKLIAQAAADQNLNLSEEIEPPKEITLPDSPPLLQAKDLTQGPIIAAPEEAENDQVSAAVDSNALSGAAVIPADQTEVKVCNDNLSPTSQIYLVAQEDSENQVLMVKRKAPFNPETGECSHFVVTIQKPLEEDLRFRWWIVEN